MNNYITGKYKYEKHICPKISKVAITNAPDPYGLWDAGSGAAPDYSAQIHMNYGTPKRGKRQAIELRYIYMDNGTPKGGAAPSDIHMD